MVFKKMLRALGVGGPSVDTVLSDPRVRPGEWLTGEVRLAGGDADADIERIALSLVARVDTGQGESAVEFHQEVVCGPFRLSAKENRAVAFRFAMPWEAPITEVFGQHLHGASLGLRTELTVAQAVDKGDLDPVYVEPLPAQEAVLDAFGRLGLHIAAAELEAGRLHGVRQQLPFFQQIEFYPPPGYAGMIEDIELTFVADPDGIQVVLGADKRSGLFPPGHDDLGRIGVSHAEAMRTDWASAVTEWLDHLAQRRGAGAAGFGGYADHGGYGDHRGGPGIGGIIAGAAVGAVGGMIIGDMIEDAFEDDFED